MLYLFFHQESLQAKGLRDDTTCIVVDILPQEKPPISVPIQKKPVKGMLKAIFRKKSSDSSMDKEYMEPDEVRELYEEGSAMLSERFGFVISYLNICCLPLVVVFSLDIETSLSVMQVRNKISPLQHVQVVYMRSVSSGD